MLSRANLILALAALSISAQSQAQPTYWRVPSPRVSQANLPQRLLAAHNAEEPRGDCRRWPGTRNLQPPPERMRAYSRRPASCSIRTERLGPGRARICGSALAECSRLSKWSGSGPARSAISGRAFFPMWQATAIGRRSAIIRKCSGRRRPDWAVPLPRDAETMSWSAAIPPPEISTAGAFPSAE